jgi:hypothetical protein
VRRWRLEIAAGVVVTSGGWGAIALEAIVAGLVPGSDPPEAATF